jgi:hypothetical protein
MTRFTTLKMAAMAVALLSATATEAKVSTSISGRLVISKVFYAGTTQIGSSKNYNGGEEYVELYNNSADTLQIGGTYIGLVESESSTGAYPAGSITTPASGIALKQLYRIPSTFTDSIMPYHTVLIASSAIDHSALTQNGPDLSKADLEFANPSTDNSAVPNLELVYSFLPTVTAFNLANGGDASILLFPSSFESKLDLTSLVYAQGKTAGSQYLTVNSYYCTDAVEILKSKIDTATGIYSADSTRKRIDASYDAGYVITPTDATMNKDGNVVYRKTALNYHGDITLYDTNNSKTDFTVSKTIAPRSYNETPDGTTDTTIVIPESGYLPLYTSSKFFGGNDVIISYVTVSSGKLKYLSYPGNSIITGTTVYIIIGTPGEHTLKLTQADRTVKTAGSHYWLADNDTKYVNGVYTTTINNRYPLKFVNEKGNVRFATAWVDGNNKTMQINPETEGRFFIMVNFTPSGDIAWEGATLADVAAGINNAIFTKTDEGNNAIYDLTGRKVNTISKKGIYIKNGKKFVAE